jgi:hypothetical protein
MGALKKEELFPEEFEEQQDTSQNEEFSNKDLDNVFDINGKADKSLSTCFYKVSNHLELFKIGKSFYEDYKNGYKSFAISSTGYHTSQQQTILGLASFFDHSREKLNVLIISDNIFDGTYKEVISSSTLNELKFGHGNLSCEVHSFYDHFDFLDLHALAEKRQGDEYGDYDTILEMLFEGYDIILWDVPELNLLKECPDVYFPVITRFDCLSIVVSNNVSRTKDVEQICDFFSSYGLSLKGLLIDSIALKEKANEEKSEKKKSWWRKLVS